MLDLPRPGIEPVHRQLDSLPLSHQGSPNFQILLMEFNFINQVIHIISLSFQSNDHIENIVFCG